MGEMLDMLSQLQGLQTNDVQMARLLGSLQDQPVERAEKESSTRRNDAAARLATQQEQSYPELHQSEMQARNMASGGEMIHALGGMPGYEDYVPQILSRLGIHPDPMAAQKRLQAKYPGVNLNNVTPKL